MSNAYFQVPEPFNEPVYSYAPGSPEKIALKKKLAEMSAGEVEIPLIIGGKAVKTGNLAESATGRGQQRSICKRIIPLTCLLVVAPGHDANQSTTNDPAFYLSAKQPILDSPARAGRGNLDI